MKSMRYDRKWHDLAIFGFAICFSVMVAASIWLPSAKMSAYRDRVFPVTSVRCADKISCEASANNIQIHEVITSDASFDVSFVQLIVSSLGIVGLILTVYYARLAWVESENSANIAKQNLRHSEDASERQLRPYLFVDQTIWYWIWDVNNRDKIVSWRFNVFWKNVGQTPAGRVRTRANLQVFDSAEPPSDFGFPDVGEIISERAGSIGPGQSIQNMVHISIDDAIAIYNREKSAFIWAWSEYSASRIGPRFRTEWHGRIIVMQDPREKDCIFQFLIERDFNGYDESCFHDPETQQSQMGLNEEIWNQHRFS